MNYYIADTHFGHENIISFDNRPFKTVEDMTEEIVSRWNKRVSAGDTVYVLGDMFWCGAEKATTILEELKGRKFLIKGNHDRCHDNRFKKKFEKITEYLEIKDNDRDVVLCHYPIPCFKNHYYGWYHLYGHVHTSFEHNMMLHNRQLMKDLYNAQCQMYNTGCMLPYMDYTPRTLDEIIEANKQ